MEYFNKGQSTGVTTVNPEMGRGELVIVVPSEAQHMIMEGKPLRVGVEFSLEKPHSGLHFVVPSTEGTLVEARNSYFAYCSASLVLSLFYLFYNLFYFCQTRKVL